MSHVVPMSHETSEEINHIWNEIYHDANMSKLDQVIVDVINACYRVLISEMVHNLFRLDVVTFASKIKYLDYSTYTTYLADNCPIDNRILKKLMDVNSPIVEEFEELLPDNVSDDREIANAFGQMVNVVLPSTRRFINLERLLHCDIIESGLLFAYNGTFIVTVRPNFKKFVITDNLTIRE